MFGFRRQNLSMQDVERLLASPDPQNKIEMAARILAEVPNLKNNPVELVLAGDIISRLAQDTELVVRQAVAWQVAHSPILSPELAGQIARDVASVAFPILRYGPLTDEVLLDVLKDSDGRKALAVAGRKEVSEAVSEALVSCAYVKAISVLMGNTSAKISDKTLHTVLDRYGIIPAVNSAMAKREDMAASVVLRLVMVVSDRIRDQLTETYDLPPEEVETIVRTAREVATVQLLRPIAEHIDQLSAFIEQIDSQGQLTPSFILRALCAGEINLFRQTLAYKGRLPMLAIDELLRDRGPLGLPALMRRCSIPMTLLPAFKAAIHVFRESDYKGDREGRATYQASAIAAVFDDCMPIDDLELDELLQDIVSPLPDYNSVAEE